MAAPAPRSFSPRPASGAVHAWVSETDGRRYSADDRHHRLLLEIERPRARRSLFMTCTRRRAVPDFLRRALASTAAEG
jgi:hypothetical protein